MRNFERNIERDAENDLNLRRKGWRVVRIWEHEVKHEELANHAVERVLGIVGARRNGASV